MAYSAKEKLVMFCSNFCLVIVVIFLPIAGLLSISAVIIAFDTPSLFLSLNSIEIILLTCSIIIPIIAVFCLYYLDSHYHDDGSDVRYDPDTGERLMSERRLSLFQARRRELESNQLRSTGTRASARHYTPRTSATNLAPRTSATTWAPRTSATTWAPRTSATLWAPRTSATNLAPRTSATTWTPRTPATTWTPRTSATLWTPRTSATLWTPRTSATLWTPRTSATPWAPRTSATLWAPTTSTTLWAPRTSATTWTPRTSATLWAPTTSTIKGNTTTCQLGKKLNDFITSYESLDPDHHAYKKIDEAATQNGLTCPITLSIIGNPIVIISNEKIENQYYEEHSLKDVSESPITRGTISRKIPKLKEYCEKLVPVITTHQHDLPTTLKQKFDNLKEELIQTQSPSQVTFNTPSFV